MPKVALFLYCDNAQMENIPGQHDAKLHVFNPLTTILPAFIPTTYSFSIVIGILGVSYDAQHVLRYIFKGPNENQKVIIDTGNVPVQTPPTIPSIKKNLPAELKGINVSLDFRNFLLTVEGEYKSEVFLDGESLGEYPIYVKAVGIDESNN